MDVPWYAGHGGCLVVRLMGAIEVFFGCATRPIYGQTSAILIALIRSMKAERVAVQ